MSSKAQGPGEYVFTTVKIYTVHSPQPCALIAAFLHGWMKQANTTDTVFSHCKLSAHFLRIYVYFGVFFYWGPLNGILLPLVLLPVAYIDLCNVL